MTTQEQQKTSTSNVEYDLVSVIYHALESALSSSIYVTDAQWIGDQELARFFWNNQNEDRRVADQAEQLLSNRLSQSQSSQTSQTSQNQFGQGQSGGYGYNYGPGMSGYGGGMYGGGYGPGMGGYGGGMYGSYGPGMGMGGYGYGNQFGGGQYGGGMYSGQFGGGQFGGSGMPSVRQVTGTSDVTYDLISTIYHALESAQTCDSYLQDAQQANDQETVQFFQQMQQRCNQRAEQAKSLLAPRLSQKRWYQGGVSGSSFSGQGTQTGGSQTASSSSTGSTGTSSPGTGSQG